MLADVLFQADRRHRAKALALLDVVQAIAHRVGERRRQDRAVAERTRADFAAALRPGHHLLLRQEGRDPLQVQRIDIDVRHVRQVVDERTVGIDVPFDLGLTGELAHRVDGRTDRRTGIVGARRHEHVAEQAAVAPHRVPVAVQAAAAGDQQRIALGQVLLRIEIEAVEDLIRIALGQARERRMIEADVVVLAPAHVLLRQRGQDAVALEQKLRQLALVVIHLARFAIGAQRHQLARILVAQLALGQGEGRIGQRVQEGILVARGHHHAAQAGHVQLLVDLVEVAERAFPNQHVARLPLLERRQAVAAPQVRALVAAAEVFDVVSEHARGTLLDGTVIPAVVTGADRRVGGHRAFAPAADGEDIRHHVQALRRIHHLRRIEGLEAWKAVFLCLQ